MTRQRLPTEEERERRAPAAPPPHPLLEFQRGAGNRAVSAMLARDAKEQEEATGSRAILPGVGTIPLESVQLGVNRRGRPSRGREDGEKEGKAGEITVTSKVGEHSQKLFKASLDGKPMAVEIVVAGSGGSFRLKLKGALISNFSVHEDHESWTLNFEDMEQASRSSDAQPSVTGTR